MTTSNPSDIFVLGAGGIGCALGHALAAGGVSITMVDADHDKLDWGRSNGVEIEGHGAHQASFVHFDEWDAPSTGLLLLCTKCYDNATVLDRVGPGVTIVPVQNGFDPQLQQRCSFEGIASFVSECQPGRTLTMITRPGDLHVGSCRENGSLPDDLSRVVQIMEEHAAFTVKRVKNILPFKHTKLMYNAAISPLAAVTGLDNGQLLTHAPARRLFFAFLRENYAILKRAGTPLGTVGPFHPDTVNRILRTPLLGTIMAGRFSRSLRGTYCSMSGDIQAGRTEIDNFNGHLVRLAGEDQCPLNRSACKLVSRMANERATPAMPYLDELAA